MGEMATYILPAVLLLASAKDALTLKQLQGTWEVVSETWAGYQLPDDLRLKEVVIKGNTVTQTSVNHTDVPGKDHIEKAVLRFRTVDSPPFGNLPAFDLVDQDQDMGYFAALYKLDNEMGTLTICYVIRRSQDRPTEFASTKDNTNALLVLKRKKTP
jgi:uncharacterized protein (TIGR03067 family)